MRSKCGLRSGSSGGGGVGSKIENNMIGKRSGSVRSTSETRATIQVVEEFWKAGRVSKQ